MGKKMQGLMLLTSGIKVTLVLLFCCNLQMCLGFGAFQYNVASAPTPMSTVSGIVLNAGPYGGEVNHHTFQVPPGPYFAECWTATTGAPVTGGPGTHNAFGVSPYGYATADQLPPPPPYCVLTYWSGPCERSTDAPSARATGSVVATYSAAAQPPTGVFQVIHHSAQLVCDDNQLSLSAHIYLTGKIRAPVVKPEDPPNNPGGPQPAAFPGPDVVTPGQAGGVPGSAGLALPGWTFFPARPTYNPSLADCQAAFGMIPTNTTGVTIATKAQFTSVSCGIYFNGDRPMGLTDFATVAAYLIVNNTSPDGRSTGGSAAGVPVAQQRNNTGLSVVVDFQYKTGNDQGTNFDIAVDNSIDEILQNYKVPNDPDWATYPWNDEFMASLGKFVSIDSGIQARDASVAYSDPASSLPSIPLEDCTPGLQRNDTEDCNTIFKNCAQSYSFFASSDCNPDGGPISRGLWKSPPGGNFSDCWLFWRCGSNMSCLQATSQCTDIAFDGSGGVTCQTEPITPSCVGLQCQSDSDCCDGYHCGSTMIGSTKSCQQGGD